MTKITRIDMGADVNEFNLVTVFYEDGGKLSVSIPSHEVRARKLNISDILDAVEARLGVRVFTATSTLGEAINSLL